MKKFFTLFLFTFFSIISFAQTAIVKGILKDTSTTKQSLKDATISVLDIKDSTVQVFGLAKEDGSFELKGFGWGTFLVQISFNGYETIFKKIEVSKTNATVNFGTIYLKVSPNTLEGVVVKTSPVVIKGDTTEFNASSFKTKPNATAEDLLKKLPGVEVDKEGTVKAQGQNVTKVLVDGKKFFGDDPKTATRNLPTDVIDKIQVYDAQSDQSAFSGFDDGNREKTINIVTKKDKRKGYFGKLSAGAGNNERFATSASVNKFNGNQQISFIGQGNNINQQNFSIQDVLGVLNAGGGNRGGGGSGMARIGNFLGGNQAGISRTWAAGINYNDVWGKKTSVSSSYFYNNLKNTNDNENYRETFSTIIGDSSQYNSSKSVSGNTNQNHRFNFEIEHKFDSLNSLMIRPSISFQNNERQGATNTITTKGLTTNLSNVQQTTNNVSNGYNFSTSILFRHKFQKRGRTISINFTPSINMNENNGTNISYNEFFKSSAYIKDTINQISKTSRDGKTFTTNVSYTEPLSKKAQIELNYNNSYSLNTSNQQTSRFNPATGLFDIVVTNLTNKFENTNLSNRFGINYRHQVNKEWNYIVGIGTQFAELSSNNQTKNTNLSNKFTNYFPTLQIQYSKARTNNLRFNYRGRTNAPSISQLQEVIDNTNQLNIKNGNASLAQEFQHSFSLFYTNFDVITFKNFVIGVNGNFTQNKIGNSIYLNTDTVIKVVENVVLIPGAQYSKPININGAVNVTTFVNYGFPLKKPKANINLSTTISYIRDVNLYNGNKSFTNNYAFGERVSFTMNLKERFDLNFFSTSTYTLARYVQSSSQNQNGDFFTQVFSVEPTYTTKNGFIIGNDFDLTMYRGQSVGYNQTIPLWNASVAKTVFKKKDGEIKLTIYDLLNENKSITRTVEQNYIQDSRTTVLTRYFLVSFVYNIRKFAGKGQQMPPMMKGMFRRNGEPRGGGMIRMGDGGGL